MAELSRRSAAFRTGPCGATSSGERAHVREDVADRLAAALNQPFGYLWPDRLL